jgi:hypothetical protein
MIAWILSLWSWVSKFSWGAKVVSFVPIIKQYRTFIIIGILVIYMGILKFENIKAENRYLKCENEHSTFLQDVQAAQKAAETAAVAAEQIIEKNNEINKIVKKQIKAETKNESDAITIMRRYL